MSTNGDELFYMPTMPIPWAMTKVKVHGPDSVYTESYPLPAYRGSVGFMPYFNTLEEAEAFLAEEGYERQDVEILEFSLRGDKESE